MFSLIITVISIALVAALALATIYYGGSAFNKGSDGAKAAQLINEGQQVNGAVAMYKADATGAGTAVTGGLADLQSNGYLAQIPASFTSSTVDLSKDSVVVSAATVTKGVCQEVQKRAGGSTTITSAQPTGQLFGCYGDGANANTFFYKF